MSLVIKNRVKAIVNMYKQPKGCICSLSLMTDFAKYNILGNIYMEMVKKFYESYPSLQKYGQNPTWTNGEQIYNAIVKSLEE